MALRWRAEGAQVIGGCCGVGPEHIAAARVRVADTLPGRERPVAPPRDHPGAENAHPALQRSRGASAPPWTDSSGRSLNPLDFPELGVGAGVFAPTAGSFLVWRHLFKARVGAGRRCLDVGCGTGLQTIQLARNGAAHVHAIDLDPDAVQDTIANAFRNGVAERVTAAEVDLYPWVPEERYGVIVASLYQTPVDPFQQVAGHRPIDYWGRNLVDHLVRVLPDALSDDGVAYVMQLSLLSARRTSELLAEAGLESRVADVAFFEIAGHFEDSLEQIGRVEAASDAYHLDIGGEDTMIAYLLEIRREGGFAA